MRHVAIDSDLFFYSISSDKKDRKVQLADGILDHINNNQELVLYVPLSVLRERDQDRVRSLFLETACNRLALT